MPKYYWLMSSSIDGTESYFRNIYVKKIWLPKISCSFFKKNKTLAPASFAAYN